MIVRELRRRGTGYAAVRVMLPDAEGLFRRALFAIGTIPADQMEEVSRVVLEDGLSVARALDGKGY